LSVERLVSDRDLEARLQSVEKAAQRVLAGSGVVPSMVTILRFADDSPEAARAFADELRAFFAEARPDLFIQTIDFAFPRPPRLLPQWRPGERWWLDKQPTPAMLADLRPDLREPVPGSRWDWRPDDAQ
jgi:hypothetical protein